MTTSIASSTPATAPASPALQWHGHMADDVGATYGHEPLALLNATATELLLSGNRGTFRLPRSAVVRVSRGGMYPWFFRSVRLHHSLPGISTELQFKPLGATRRAVLDGLKSLGYPVR
jgi:hypothetical protein